MLYFVPTLSLFAGQSHTHTCTHACAHEPTQNIVIYTYILLASQLYNYDLMVKSVSCCYVHESRLFLVAVTYVIACSVFSTINVCTIQLLLCYTVAI